MPHTDLHNVLCHTHCKAHKAGHSVW